MGKFTFGLVILGAVLATGCGPLAAPLDQGTEPPVKIVFGGEAAPGRPPAGLDGADLAVASGDPATLRAAGIDLLVTPAPAEGFTTVSGTEPYRKEIGGYDLAVFGATSPEADKEALLRKVRAVAADADFVAVYLARSPEEGPCPDENRRALTGALVKAGADAVVSAGEVRPGGYLAEGTGFVHHGLGFLSGGRGGLLTLEVTRNTVHTADWTPSTARGPLTGTVKDDALREWSAARTTCPGLTEGPAALRTS